MSFLGCCTTKSTLTYNVNSFTTTFIWFLWGGSWSMHSLKKKKVSTHFWLKKMEKCSLILQSNLWRQMRLSGCSKLTKTSLNGFKSLYMIIRGTFSRSSLGTFSRTWRSACSRFVLIKTMRLETTSSRAWTKTWITSWTNTGYSTCSMTSLFFKRMWTKTFLWKLVPTQNKSKQLRTSQTRESCSGTTLGS